MHDVFKVFLNGTHTRGTGGVVYINFVEDRIGYLFPHEFSDAAFRGSLQDLLEDDDAPSRVHVVEELDGKMHV